MLFLATVIFVCLFYIVPGFWLVDLGVRWGAIPFVSPAVFFWLLAAVCYGACLLAVYFGRWAYDELQLEREAFQPKPYLDARAIRWLTWIGLPFIGWQFYEMTTRWAMPYQFAPLYVALLIGFFDLRRRPVSLALPDGLPGPRYVAPMEPGTGAGEEITLRWEYLARGNSPEVHMFEMKLGIDREHYERARHELHFVPSKPADYARFATQGPMDDLRLLAARLRAESQARGYDPVHEVENVVRMVRSLSYRADAPEPADQPKYPLQTLADGGGDCEDFAILAASLLWQLGHTVALLYVETDATAHMALGYRTDTFEGSFTATSSDGRQYSYIETVPSSEEMGEMPEEFLQNLRRAVVVPL